MKNRLQSSLVIIFLLIYTQFTFGQNHSFSDKYDLNFDFQNKKKLSWTIDPLHPVILQPDSTQTIRGKHPFHFVQPRIGPFFNPINASIHQTVLLPVTNSDSATIMFTCKSKNLRLMQLIIWGENDRELITHIDTLMALGKEDWTTFSRTILIRGAVLLHFNIVAQGKMNDTTEQKLYLDKIEIKIGGKNINDFVLPAIPVVADLKKSDVISLFLSESNSFKSIPEIGNHKIVAIGETIHGSENINAAAIELIKYQIQHNQCKLIILELPTEQTLYWNRYIQGDTLFEIKHFAHQFSLVLYSPRVMIDFFQWLRLYNEKVKDKVWLLGMDISYTPLHCCIYLNDFLSSLNKKKHIPLIDSMCSNLSKYNLSAAIVFLKNQKELEELLSHNEFSIIRYCMNTTNSGFQSNQRDDIMYLRASFLIKQICTGDEKTSIYAHFAHTNPLKKGLNLSFTPPFGYFMKNKFGNDYYSIAILSGKGNFRTKDQDSLFTQKLLQTPPSNSMEDLLMRTGEEICYVPVSILPQQLMYMRDVGNTYMENQFEILAPASRMDAVMFVRNSKAFDLLPESLKDSEDYMINYKQWKERLQKISFSNQNKK